MADGERLTKFLSIVPTAGAGWCRNVPPVWNAELRAALSDNLIKIGWGGRIELTDAGRDAVKQK
jgi:hypothetical protein